MPNPDVDFMSLGSDAQSASQYAVMDKGMVMSPFLSSKAWLTDPFRYETELAEGQLDRELFLTNYKRGTKWKNRDILSN